MIVGYGYILSVNRNPKPEEAKAMSNLTQYQIEVVDLYGLIVCDTIEDETDGVIAVCEVDHPNGSVDVYIHEDGSIYVEEGDDLDGYDMIPLADSFLASRFR